MYVNNMEAKYVGTFEEDSDTESEEDIESELYSVLHYTDLSQGIPDDIAQKYRIEIGPDNEMNISLRQPECKPPEIEQSPGNDLNLNPVTKNKKGRSFVEIDVSEDEEVAWKKPKLGTESDDILLEANDQIPVVTLSDSDSAEQYEESDDDDIILNIGPEPEIVTVSDSETEEPSSEKLLDWKTIDTPTTWTRSMKKYYNKPSKRLKEFCEFKEIRKMRAQCANWFINGKDLYPKVMRKSRCHICNDMNHKSDRCPKRRMVCHMCGEEGHLERSCPSSMCLNCGNKNNCYILFCPKCRGNSSPCPICKKIGHNENNCTDIWRRYHATNGGLPNFHQPKPNQKVYCCNCSNEGHYYEDCNRPYWSEFKPRSSFVTNYRGEEGIVKSVQIILPDVISIEGSYYKKVAAKFQTKGLKISPTGRNNFVNVEGKMYIIKQFQHGIYRLKNFLDKQTISKVANKRKGKKGKPEIKKKKKKFWSKKNKLFAINS